MAPGKLTMLILMALAAAVSATPALVAPALFAQQPAPEITKEEEFWFSTPRRRAAVAAQLVLAQDPALLAVLRHKTLTELVWGEFDVIGDAAPPLNPELLDLIHDGRPLPDLRAKEDKEIRKVDRATYHAYNQALVNGFRYPLEAFKKSAKDHEHLKFAHLWNEPDLHRGKVVTVEGRLARLRKFEAPREAQQNGVKWLYEGWLFAQPRGSHPFCIVFPVLPDALAVAEKMDRRVTFHGYFLMRYKYRAQKGDLETPLLIGPTVVLARSDAAPGDDSTPFPVFALVLVGIILAGIVVGMMIISWWFRRGDTRIQSRLADLQHRRVRDMMDAAPEWNEDKPQ
jgi:hypothetical protein